MTRFFLILLLACVALPAAAWARGETSEASKPEEAPPAVVGLDFSFKLDPRLTHAQYMGDRWVALPTFTINAAGTTATVDARAHGVDPNGQRASVRPTWSPADPAMVSVAPDEGSEVKITVHGAGESRLRVTADGISRDLTVKAVENNGALLVEIAQMPAAGTPEAEERARILAGRTETTGYALGVDFGRKLTQHLAEVDADSLAQGLEDGLEGRTLLTEAELQTALDAFQRQQQAKQLKDLEEARVDGVRALAEKNRTEGEAFLAENRTKEGVVTLASGLQYKVLIAGDGPTPTPADTVICHFRGTYIDGTEFDSSYVRPLPGTFPLKRVIPAWREALPLMPVGSKWRLFVPPDLAYGVRGSRRGIGPNTTLVFEVELLGIKATQTARLRESPGSTPTEDAR